MDEAMLPTQILLQNCGTGSEIAQFPTYQLHWPWFKLKITAPWYLITAEHQDELPMWLTVLCTELLENDGYMVALWESRRRWRRAWRRRATLSLNDLFYFTWTSINSHCQGGFRPWLNFGPSGEWWTKTNTSERVKIAWGQSFWATTRYTHSSVQIHHTLSTLYP